MNPIQEGLHIGDPAPDLTLPDASGQPLRLSALWSVAPLALVFIRHYG
ncbi:MAG: hypothetical protein ACH37Z_01270 [Anaerolineae bacterium]